LPCPTQEFGNAGRNKLFSGVVTNRLTTPGDALIRVLSRYYK
jgi:hypothetical protein